MLKELDAAESPEVTTFLSSGFEKAPEYKGEVQRFNYERPTLKPGKSKAAVHLATTDLLFAVVQVFAPGAVKGGETIMHSHAGMDGFWLVLKGRAKFHTARGDVYDLAPMQGLVTPRDVKYWFEAEGDEGLELLQVDAMHPGIRNVVDFGGVDAKALQEQTAKDGGGGGFYDAREKS